MQTKKLYLVLIASITIICCKKNNLVEVVDVPATPIVALKSDLGTSNASDVKAIEGAFEMFKLPYNYTDLEPHFDAATTEIHYSKHHLGFVNNLNKAIVGTRFASMTLVDIIKNAQASDVDIKNFACGFYNHNIFWESIGPKQGGDPQGVLLEAILRDFNTIEEFKSQFTSSSLQIIGSGWTWLISDKYGILKIVTTQNNDNPYVKSSGITGTPILNLDIWEHAYYLKFQNRKRDYVNTFFSVINWESATSKYESFPKQAMQKSTISNTTSINNSETASPATSPSEENQTQKPE